MPSDATNECQFSGCRRAGVLRNGTARSMVLCDIHASMADFSDARLTRWVDVMYRIFVQFELIKSMKVGDSRRFMVTNDRGEPPILVKFENNGSVDIRNWSPILDARIGQRPFGIVMTWVHFDSTMPTVLYPWIPEEHPGVFQVIEDGDFETLTEASFIGIR